MRRAARHAAPVLVAEVVEDVGLGGPPFRALEDGAAVQIAESVRTACPVRALRLAALVYQTEFGVVAFEVGQGPDAAAHPARMVAAELSVA